MLGIGKNFSIHRYSWQKGAMPMANVILRIRERQHAFTSVQRTLARYVSQNYHEAAFFSIADLAREAGVSESSVVRFARALGFDGYPDLQRALGDMLRRQLTTVERLKHSAPGTDGHTPMLETVMHADLRAIRHTMEEIDREQFRRAVGVLRTADTIHVLGGRGTMGLAQVLGLGLHWVLRNVRLPTGSPTDGIDAMMGVQGGDVAFAISFPRYTQATLNMLKIAKDRGATTIVLTDSAISPLAQYADLLLTARCEHVSYVDSLCAPLSVINALLAEIGAQDPDQTARALEEMERVWETYGIYAEDVHRDVPS